MALSAKVKARIRAAMTNKADADALISAIESGANAQGAAVADIATADGSDAATTQALANATKAKVNALLAALRAAGIIAT